MKICPRCEAELKDSVIRCVRCGATVRGEEAEVEAPSPNGAVRTPAKVATTSSVWGGSAPPALPAATPAPPISTRAPFVPAGAAMVDRMPRRALPTRRAFGPDPIMLLAGLAAATAGVLAYLAIKEPWVHLTITQEATDTTPALVATLSLRGRAAFVGTAGMAIAVALGVMGLIWFLYGFQRGWAMPGIVNPGIGLLVTTAGLVATALAAMVWFVWQDAMVKHAKAAHLATAAMKKLVEAQPAPLVQIQRLSGLLTFAGMMVFGLLGSCLGWYAYRRREG